MKFTVKAQGLFSKQLQARIEKWSGSVATRIRIPEELRFLYWQEYGIPGHTIVPVEAKVLAFPGEGGTQLRESVSWPGTKPTRTISKSLDEIHAAAAMHLQGALQAGGADDPELVRRALLEATEEAKAVIAEGLATDLPGTRPENPEYPKQSGRLHGETASDVFTALAEVVEVEE